MMLLVWIAYQRSKTYMASLLDELVIHNQFTMWHLCHLHCQLIFVIILTSSHKVMFFIEYECCLRII
jgi:hypothetical protein